MATRLGRKYEERLVGVRRFVQDPRYLGLERGVYPVILDTLSRIFHGKYEEAVLCWGIGSGKSFLCSLALLYMLYRTLCLRNPQEYYQLAEGSQITLCNVGPTARIAEKVIYGEVRELVRRSPWFCEKYQADNRVRKELHFPKNISLIPGNSSETFPLGLNVLCATMDEASYFVESLDGQREVAEDVYLALQRRVKSRFGNAGLLMIASSPRHADDFIMRKLAEAETNGSVYASRKATWEVKPANRFCGRKFKHGTLRVPVEFEGEFRRNELKAMRDLAAQPGAAYQPFFVDMMPLIRATSPPSAPLPQENGWTKGSLRWDGQDTALVTASDTFSAVRPPSEALAEGVGSWLRHPFEGNGQLARWFRPNDREQRFIHIDLGLRRDACGVAMAKVVCERGMPVVVVELMLQIKAPINGEVDFSQVRELILAIRDRGFPIGQVSYDGWQSADSQQILRRQGLRVATVSVDRDLEAYETLKEMANGGRLRLYDFPPFLEECAKLELVKGTKVDHPPGGSKDVADAVAGAVGEAMRHWRGEGGAVRGRIV